MSEEEQHKNDEIERRRQERLKKVTAEAKIKAEKKSKSKARRQAKREEAKLEAERRVEVKRVESNQRRQRAENITGERPSGLERQAKQAETQRKAHEQAQKKNPKKNRKEKKRQHRATKKEATRKLSILQRRRLTEPARPELVSNAIEGNVQRWFISGEGYTIPSEFLNHTEEGVKEVVDRVSGPKKVYAVLKCVLVKHNLKTGERVFSDLTGIAKPTRSPPSLVTRMRK